MHTAASQHASAFETATANSVNFNSRRMHFLRTQLAHILGGRLVSMPRRVDRNSCENVRAKVTRASVGSTCNHERMNVSRQGCTCERVSTICTSTCAGACACACNTLVPQATVPMALHERACPCEQHVAWNVCHARNLQNMFGNGFSGTARFAHPVSAWSHLHSARRFGSPRPKQAHPWQVDLSGL